MLCNDSDSFIFQHWTLNTEHFNTVCRKCNCNWNRCDIYSRSSTFHPNSQSSNLLYSLNSIISIYSYVLKASHFNIYSWLWHDRTSTNLSSQNAYSIPPFQIIHNVKWDVPDVNSCLYSNLIIVGFNRDEVCCLSRVWNLSQHVIRTMCQVGWGAGVCVCVGGGGGGGGGRWLILSI